MCQDLPLGCLNCLFGGCCAKTETLAVVFEFLYLLEREKILKFLHMIDIQISYVFLIFIILGLQKYGPCSDHYRLFSF